ncbi:MAG: lipopolysaccharide heptosyltransferase II [Pirellulales bacterium]
MSLSAEPQVLIVRLSAIGDCLLTLPLANAIKERYPRSRITWVVEKAAAPLLQNHPAIDRLIELPRGWLRSPSEVWRLRRQLQQESYEIAFDPQSLSKSAVVAWLAGAPRRVGFARPQGRELAPLLNNVNVEPTSDHLVDRQLELLHAVSIRWPEVRFQIPNSVAARQWVSLWLDPLPLSQGFVALNPGATWESKRWPTERYGQLAHRLAEQTGLRSLVVWGGRREREWAEHVVAQSAGQATLAPATSLPELAAILRRARLFIGSDTGPLHLAAAVGTPCVGMYGTTRPEHCGPYGTQHRALQVYYQAGTSRQRRQAPNTAMREITVEMVLDACQQLLPQDALRRVA